MNNVYLNEAAKIEATWAKTGMLQGIENKFERSTRLLFRVQTHNQRLSICSLLAVIRCFLQRVQQAQKLSPYKLDLLSDKIIAINSILQLPFITSVTQLYQTNS